MLALVVLLMAGCGAMKPKGLPDWYTAVPQDYNYFYAAGSGDDRLKARNSAILSLRHSLQDALNAEFKKKGHKLGELDASVLAELSRASEELCNTLSLRNTAIVKTAADGEKSIVLISFSREELFKTLQTASQEKLPASKQKFQEAENEMPLRKYIVLKELAKEYAFLAAHTQLKALSVSTFRAYDDFVYLKSLHESLKELRSSISFYVLSDANSLLFVKHVKESILNEGFALSTKSSDERAFRLLINSTTQNGMDYSFMESKNLLKFNLYENDKKEIAFRQHTFIGKSRKNHNDAKDQAAVNLNAMIKRLGFFDLIGL